MQKFINVKQMILLIGLLMPTVWCSAINLGFADGLSGITINKCDFDYVTVNCTSEPPLE